MTLEENKTLVRRYFEDAPNDPEVCDAVFAPVFLYHTLQQAENPDGESNPESEKDTYRRLRKTWGEWHATVDELIAEGDRVMMRFTFHGIQQGEYCGIPATNREVCFTGINIFRVENGKIAELWDITDRIWIWQQLGVLQETKEFLKRARERFLSASAV